MEQNQLQQLLEALIFASDSPLSFQNIQKIIKDSSEDDLQQAIRSLQEQCQNRGIVLKKVAGGYQFATKPEFAPYVGQMLEERASSRLSRAALEALAVVAFKQPISRVEVSAIRGVNSDGVMKKLLDMKLITIAGRDDGPGRALLFKTTPEFLQYFGINDISDLPRPKEIEELLAEGEGGKLLKELPDEAVMREESEESSDDSEHSESEVKSETDRDANQ